MRSSAIGGRAGLQARVTALDETGFSPGGNARNTYAVVATNFVQYHHSCAQASAGETTGQRNWLDTAKGAVLGAWLPIKTVEIVVVSTVVSGKNRVSQASSTRLTQLKPGARGSSKAGRVHRGLHPLSA